MNDSSADASEGKCIDWRLEVISFSLTIPSFMACFYAAFLRHQPSRPASPTASPSNAPPHATQSVASESMSQRVSERVSELPEWGRHDAIEKSMVDYINPGSCILDEWSLLPFILVLSSLSDERLSSSSHKYDSLTVELAVRRRSSFFMYNVA
eukprot:3935422-Prymnesium_polylepis.1